MQEIESELGTVRTRQNERKVLTVEDASQGNMEEKPQRLPPYRTGRVVSGTREVEQGWENEPLPQVKPFSGHEHETPHMVLTDDQVMEFETKKRQAKPVENRLSASAKDRIKFLTGLGRQTDEFAFDNVSFKIQTLKAGELKEISKSLDVGMKNLDLAFEVRAQTLARSLVAINGYPVGQVLGEDTIDARLALINELDENAIAFINRKYEAMVTNAKKKFGLDVVASDEIAKEVAEDIKKS